MRCTCVILANFCEPAEAVLQIYEGCHILFDPKDLIPAKLENHTTVHHPFVDDLLYKHVHDNNKPTNEESQNTHSLSQMNLERDITVSTSHIVIGLKMHTAYFLMPRPEVPVETMAKWFDNHMLSAVDQKDHM